MSARERQSLERVVFRGRRGGRLVGVWHHGVGQRGVILCHGMESSKEGLKSVRMAENLAAAGCDVLRFDFSYVGESEGEFLDLTVSGEVEDLAGAWQFARQRVAGPLGIVGSSLGGTVALLFAAQEADVAALATIAAVAVPGRLARRLSAEERLQWQRDGVYPVYGVPLRYGFLEDVEALDVLAAVRRIQCPLLVTHGTDDEIVPCADGDAIAEAVPSKAALLRYAGADHRFSDAALLDRLLGDIVEWMLARLEADAPGTTLRRAVAERA